MLLEEGWFLEQEVGEEPLPQGLGGPDATAHHEEGATVGEQALQGEEGDQDEGHQEAIGA